MCRGEVLEVLFIDMQRYVELRNKVADAGHPNDLERDEFEKYISLNRQYIHETGDIEGPDGKAFTGWMEKYRRRNGRPKYFKCVMNRDEGPAISSVDHGLLAEYMRDSPKYRLGLANGVPVVWNGTHYECGFAAVAKAAAGICREGCDYTYYDKQLKEEVAEHVTYSWNMRLEQDFIHYVRFTMDCAVKTLAPPNLVQFQNGVLDIVKYAAGDDHCFSDEPDPEIIILNVIPHDWIPNMAPVEVVDKMLDDMSCSRENVRLSLEELAGHCLYRDKGELQTLGLIQGEAGNGKSTFCSFLEYSLGAENVSHVPLSALGKAFSGAQLMAGKLANIDPDAAGGFHRPDAVSVVKLLSAGDAVQVDIKHHDPLTFTSYATLVVASNNDLKVSSNDAGKAVLQRLVFIPCDANLRESPDRDRQILRKLRTDEAATYFLKLAVDGLCRLLAHEARFSIQDEADELRERFKQINDPIYAWLADTEYTAARFITWNPDGIEGANYDDVSANVVVDLETGATWDVTEPPFAEFSRWCRSTGRQAEGLEIKFSNRIKKEFKLTRGNPKPTKGDGRILKRQPDGTLGKRSATSYRPYYPTAETILHDVKPLSQLTAPTDKARLAALQAGGGNDD